MFFPCFFPCFSHVFPIEISIYFGAFPRFLFHQRLSPQKSSPLASGLVEAKLCGEMPLGGALTGGSLRNRNRRIRIGPQPLVNSHGYGSIPIDTIFSGMNIHLPAILGFTRYQGFDPSPHSYGKSPCSIGK